MVVISGGWWQKLAAGYCLSNFLMATANAQIVSDDSTNTTVNLENNIWQITDGERAGNNLFHSFERFSVLQNQTASFNNAADISNIFSRVTGNSISEISGLIQTQGTASLFLINPNGIIFNEGAALDIGGSFTATTADSIVFDDGMEFSAVNSEAPLLTITSPIGLQLGKNPGAIAVNGRGHNLANGGLNNPFIRQPNLSELRVRSGSSLNLIGGDITFNGGVLVAELGTINLASLRNTQISLIDLNHPLNAIANLEASNFQDINLDRQSLIDVSGTTGGSINILSNNLTVDANSQILIQKFADENDNFISIGANDTISLNNGSAITTENLNTGSTAAIAIQARNLSLTGGGNISSLAYQASVGRAINLDIAENVEVVGFNAFVPSFPSVIAAVSLGTGKAPDVNLTAVNLSLQQGGNLASAAFNIGAGGNVNLDIDRAVAISGTSSLFLPSGISAVTSGFGQGGNIAIATDTLTIDDSGIINAATVRGNSGNIDILARESVAIRGANPDVSLPSTIVSSVQQAFEEFPFPDVIDFPEQLSGVSGSISIQTPKLAITEGASIAVTNDGINPGGNLNITTDSLLLDRQGTIFAQTLANDGGNITLNIDDYILLRDRSQISATADRIGQGGNIAIDTTLLTAVNNSDITADAGDNFGGQISINARSVLGTEIRDRITSQSDITATSGLGAEFSGVVEIDLTNTQPAIDTLKLPDNFIEATQKIVSSCRRDLENSFIVTGKGGIPASPQETLRRQTILQDWRLTKDEQQETNHNLLISNNTRAEIVEADRLIINSQGKIELVTDTSPANLYSWLPQMQCDRVSNNTIN